MYSSALSKTSSLTFRMKISQLVLKQNENLRVKETEIVYANISNPTLTDICLILYLIPNVVPCDTLLL